MVYLNGEMDQTTRALFEEHLADCPDCVAYLQSYEMTVRFAHAERDTKLSEPPEELVRAILAARKGK
jgi:anti-sigma factor RsiW